MMKKVIIGILLLAAVSPLFARPSFAACSSNNSGDLPGWGPSVTLSSCNKTISAPTGVDWTTLETGTNNTSALSLVNSSLTLNSGAVLMTGSIELGSGANIAIDTLGNGVIKLGTPIYIADGDNDGWAPTAINSTTLYEATAAGRRRLAFMRAWTADCGDTTYSTGNVCCTVATRYQDADADGYGNPSVSISACTTAGYVDNASDCNDGSALVFTSHAQCYTDADGDTYTTSLAANTTCLNTVSCVTATKASTSTTGAAVTTYTAGRLRNAASGSDCNDTGTNAANVYVSATCYVDSDNDNYGSATSKTCTNNATCTSATWASGGAGTAAASGNFAANASDCYEGNASAYPGSGACSASHRGDGSYDWNCSGGASACGTIYNYAYSYTAPLWYTCDRANCGPAGYWAIYTPASIGCGQAGYAGCAEQWYGMTGCNTYENNAGDTVCNGGGVYSTVCDIPGASGTQACQ